MNADSPLVPPVELPIDLDPLCARLEELSPELQSVNDWPGCADPSAGGRRRFGLGLAGRVRRPPGKRRASHGCLRKVGGRLSDHYVCAHATKCSLPADRGQLQLRDQVRVAAPVVSRPGLCDGRNLPPDDVAAAPGETGRDGRRVWRRFRARGHGSLGDRRVRRRTHRHWRDALRWTTSADGQSRRRSRASIVSEPMRLLALSASQTATIVLTRRACTETESACSGRSNR